MDQEYLQLFLEKALKTEDFSVVLASGSALVTFFQEHSSEGTCVCCVFTYISVVPSHLQTGIVGITQLVL